MNYAIIKRDGTFLDGQLPSDIDVDKFCIMCAAAYGAGTTALQEVGDKIGAVKIIGEKSNIIIKPWKDRLLAVIGDEEDLEKIIEKLKV